LSSVVTPDEAGGPIVGISIRFAGMADRGTNQSMDFCALIPCF